VHERPIIMSRERRASEQTPATDLTPLELSVAAELNLARERPKELAEHIRAMRKQFDGKLLRREGRPAIQTKEGLAAIDEAIQFLERQPPLPPFQRVSAGMTKAARDHVSDTGRRGSVGHEGTDGSTPFDRLERHGSWRHSSGENINYFARDGRECVVQLIIDDGVPGRGHRTNIYSKDFNVVGIASGAHATMEYMVVITFAGDFVEAGGGGGDVGGGGGGVSRVAVGGGVLEDGVGKAAAGVQQLKIDKPAVPMGDVPPGGKKEVKTEVSISGKTKTTKITTVITDAKGNKSTLVETKVETS